MKVALSKAQLSLARFRARLSQLERRLHETVVLNDPQFGPALRRHRRGRIIRRRRGL
jgi:hypothetical protein